MALPSGVARPYLSQIETGRRLPRHEEVEERFGRPQRVAREPAAAGTRGNPAIFPLAARGSEGRKLPAGSLTANLAGFPQLLHRAMHRVLAARHSPCGRASAEKVGAGGLRRTPAPTQNARRRVRFQSGAPENTYRGRPRDAAMRPGPTRPPPTRRRSERFRTTAVRPDLNDANGRWLKLAHLQGAS
jgi:hypothetical protein